MVIPSTKRKAIQMVVSEGRANVRRACRAMQLGISSFNLCTQKAPNNLSLERAIVEKSQKHPRYG